MTFPIDTADLAEIRAPAAAGRAEDAKKGPAAFLADRAKSGRPIG